MKPCEQHVNIIANFEKGEKRMSDIEDKLDTIISRQFGVSEDITRIKAIVENGLKKNVDELAAAAVAVHQKIELLDDFRWFIDMINGFRTGLMKKIVYASLIGGVIVISYSFLSVVGSKELPRLLMKLWG
jgi:hypothetical protein